MVVKVHQFKSDLTISPFAPSWNFIIAEKKIDIDVDNLSRLILDKASPEYEITNAPNCKSYFFNVLMLDIEFQIVSIYCDIILYCIYILKWYDM